MQISLRPSVCLLDPQPEAPEEDPDVRGGGQAAEDLRVVKDEAYDAFEAYEADDDLRRERRQTDRHTDAPAAPPAPWPPGGEWQTAAPGAAAPSAADRAAPPAHPAVMEGTRSFAPEGLPQAVREPLPKCELGCLPNMAPHPLFLCGYRPFQRLKAHRAAR
jgi:hypothetical protein